MQSTFRARQVLAFAWGSFIPGTNTGMNVLTARVYPTVARSTGLSWMHTFGRLGAIGSAFADAALLSAGLGLGQILPLMADVPLTGAVAGLVKRRAPGAGRRIEGNGRDFCGGGFREYLTRAVATELRSGRSPPSCRSRQPSPRSTSG
ncbi:TPA: hypothetical protein QDC44_005875 [Burkholderia cepacia ATCC 25416]|uniref:hypothetical protein n=1 Tax=Burkholderia cepacia TaxID=292 RepID=UPI001CF1E2E2|nr:hypothetical protein [Burkholderia cepacia]MCA8356219.1 hypothetical protein [Burkholderia cepacia]HDR9761646.1 hypothetical protein [Burkholderia cepacia ATCC 25416]